MAQLQTAGGPGTAKRSLRGFLAASAAGARPEGARRRPVEPIDDRAQRSIRAKARSNRALSNDGLYQGVEIDARPLQ